MRQQRPFNVLGFRVPRDLLFSTNKRKGEEEEEIVAKKSRE